MIMIKEKLDNERMEQLSHHVLNDCKDEKLSARDEWYKIAVAELGKLSRLISW